MHSIHSKLPATIACARLELQHCYADFQYFAPIVSQDYIKGSVQPNNKGTNYASVGLNIHCDSTATNCLSTCAYCQMQTSTDWFHVKPVSADKWCVGDWTINNHECINISQAMRDDLQLEPAKTCPFCKPRRDLKDAFKTGD